MSVATTTDGRADLAAGGIPSTHRRRRVVGLACCGALLAVVCILSLAVGTENVGLDTVWRAVADYTDTGNEWIVHELRIPRTILGIVVGIGLGLSGAIIQGITRNPLADTQILGINSGAGLFLVASIAFLGLRSMWSYISGSRLNPHLRRRCRACRYRLGPFRLLLRPPK